MYITHNQVLVYPYADFTEDGDIELYDEFDTARHWNVKGLVVSVPKQLRFFRKEMDRIKAMGFNNDMSKMRRQELSRWSVEYDTDMQLQVGGTVLYRYINKLACIDDGQYIDIGMKRPLLLMDYGELYMALRGEERIMLNGWILVEPVEYTEADLQFIGSGVAIDVKDRKMQGIGIVREVGIMNRGYLDGAKKEDVEVSVGDTVLFRKGNEVSIEYKYHKTLNEGEHAYYRMQRRDIIAIYKKQEYGQGDV